MLPALPVEAEPSELCAPSTVINRIIHANDLDTFLHSKPCYLVKQTKHSADYMKKYEYRVCACGCSFCLNLIIDLTNKIVSVKESDVPPGHVTTGERITSSHICVTKEVLGYIDLLAEQNLFTPNFGAKKVVRALQDESHVEEILIPPDTQINNCLSYCRTSKLNFRSAIIEEENLKII